MSAKDAFLKKMQENKHSQTASIEQAKVDIQRFRMGMDDLSNQVETWLKDSGVDVSVRENEYHDKSINILLGSQSTLLERYQVVSVALSNKDKTGTIVPIGVYGYSAAGRASLTLENRPQRAVNYLLVLNSDGKWLIREEHPSGQPCQAITLNEEIFFKAIECLA
ncbi:hypothetical protein [Lelliottia sp. WAP21]|uniref:hypothetical protein n=1 Tax=Lelliottia sp. WAP21 TaxID=2877426 RepID=UPI001E4AD0EA|nr:hypothetical protein [Lelliottia sp. WAP21]